MRKLLKQYQQYTREDVHDIFSPNTMFKAGTGTWGLQGIVSVPNTSIDYIFFVTYGMSQGSHTFEEGITKDGILTWQSQPKQKLINSTIQKLIAHDELKNNVYLFLRTSNKNHAYTYLGNLIYITHDNCRECPVYFKWQIMNWDEDVTKTVLRIPSFIPSEQVKIFTSTGKQEELIETEAPAPRSSKGEGTSTTLFRTLNIDFEKEGRKNSKLGSDGEDAVAKYEKDLLTKAGRKDLADRVELTRDTKGNNAPYDILSFNLANGEDKYIEVKTTTGDKYSPFYVSSREVAFSQVYEGKYLLYRLYDFDQTTRTGKFFIKKGSIKDICEMKATNFKCEIK